MIRNSKLYHRMRLRTMRPLRRALPVVLLLFNAVIVSAGGSTPAPSGGTSDISGWNFERDGNLLLNGVWEFYWKSYLGAGEPPPKKSAALLHMAAVPMQFDNIRLEGERLPSHGYATYRLRVKGARPGEVLGIKCPLIMTAYRIWINGKQIESVGTPGTGPENTVPRRRVSLSFFSVPAPEFDIVIHVANFSHPNGGIKGPVILGSARELQRQREISIAFNLLTFGILLIMALYHLGLFLYRRNDYPILYFGLITLVFAIRSLFVGEIILTSFFPLIDWVTMLRIDALTAYLACLLGLLFYQSLYPELGSRKITAAAAAAVAALCVVAMLTIPGVISLTVSIFFLFLIFIIAYIIVILVRASLRGYREALLFLFGFVAISLAALHDMLHFFSVFNVEYIMPYAFLFFIVYQAFVLSRRFSNAMNLVERQKSDLYEATLNYRKELEERENAQQALDDYRNQLEEMVLERTREMTKANDRLQEEIRERARMEEELVKASKIESLGVFAGGIAHDFNNLLTSILGNISMARLSDSPLSALQDAENASLRAKDLTRQLLTFASGGAPIKKSISIRDLLRDTIQFALSGSRVLAVFSLPEDLWWVEVDQGQISQVIHNLVINSIQAMPDGGVISVEVKNEEIAGAGGLPLREGRYVRIVIEDTGPGVPEELARKIFDPYFTTKTHGTGLGLSICYSVVIRHDGHIYLDYTPGDGARFIIYLPASSGSGESERTRAESADLLMKRVLVMDDEESVLRVTQSMLKHMGMASTPARDGQSAVALYREALDAADPYDVVIMDLTIPGAMGGKEAIIMLKKIDADVRAIVSSGYSNDPVMADYREYGFRGVLAKPFTYQDLLDALKQVQE